MYDSPTFSFSGGMDEFSSLVPRFETSLPSSESSAIHINPGQAFHGKQGASELLGKLSRAQWQDWRNRFAPHIDTLARIAGDGEAPAKAADNARNSMGLAFDTNQRALKQDRQAFGVQQTGAQASAESRRNDLQRSASMVSAGNQARISALDRQQAILAGGMGISNIPDRVMDQ